ncbi:PQQ-dependent sugar dehydrogenase [Halomonas sp. E14]|uniref:PQQ-dependent sugar dehydrogenase n=1 Tax=Halomonas sp. E14 TaxID=3397245 RepID=UPI00403EE98B
MIRALKGATLLALALVATAAQAEETAVRTEHLDLRLVPMAEGLDDPSSLAVLPGELLVVGERTGRLQTFYNGERQAVEGLPEIQTAGQGGLFDIVASPDYADTGWLYFTYSSGDAASTATALGRGRLAGDRLVEVESLFEQNRRSEPGPHDGARLAWLGDDTLLMSIGDRGEPARAQDTQDHAGAVLRLGPQGLAPEDNPLLEQAGYLPELYSWGHRQVQGLAVDARGDVWAVEARDSGPAELLRLRAGENHGWPEGSDDAEAAGADFLDDLASGELFADDEAIAPTYRFAEEGSPSGLAVVDGRHYPAWEGHLLVGGMESGQLYRLEIAAGEVAEAEALLDASLGPVRDVRQGPDGLLYVLIGGDSGRVFRLEPAP